MKGKTSLFTHTGIFDTYIICIQKVLRIYNRVLIKEIGHILFNEQAVYETNTNMVKIIGYLAM